MSARKSPSTKKISSGVAIGAVPGRYAGITISARRIRVWSSPSRATAARVSSRSRTGSLCSRRCTRRNPELAVEGLLRRARDGGLQCLRGSAIVAAKFNEDRGHRRDPRLAHCRGADTRRSRASRRWTSAASCARRRRAASTDSLARSLEGDPATIALFLSPQRREMGGVSARREWTWSENVGFWLGMAHA
jgi:hypothetical protein